MTRQEETRQEGAPQLVFRITGALKGPVRGADERQTRGSQPQQATLGLDPVGHLDAGQEVELTLTAHYGSDPAEIVDATLLTVTGGRGVTLMGQGVTDEGDGQALLDTTAWLDGQRTGRPQRHRGCRHLGRRPRRYQREAVGGLGAEHRVQSRPPRPIGRPRSAGHLGGRGRLLGPSGRGGSIRQRAPRHRPIYYGPGRSCCCGRSIRQRAPRHKPRRPYRQRRRHRAAGYDPLARLARRPRTFLAAERVVYRRGPELVRPRRARPGAYGPERRAGLPSARCTRYGRGRRLRRWQRGRTVVGSQCRSRAGG